MTLDPVEMGESAQHLPGHDGHGERRLSVMVRSERVAGRRTGGRARRWGVPALAVVIGAAVGAVVGGVGSVGAAPQPHIAQPGYRLVAGDGGIFSFGSNFLGSAASDPATCPPNTADRDMPYGECWSMATMPNGTGYWILNAYTGAITSYGAAVSHGDRTASNTGGADLWPDSVSMASTTSGLGYWVLNSDLSGMGSVAAFGDAVLHGDEASATGGAGTNGLPVAIVATPDGGGYWTVDSDGGVFAFGTARFFGSMGGQPLNEPIMGMAGTPDGAGYWLVGADGGVFAFGDATFAGSMAGTDLNAPMTGIAADPLGGGYWLSGADGGVFAFGSAPFLGSMAGSDLRQPVFGISTAWLGVCGVGSRSQGGAGIRAYC